jgi:cytochrome P450
MVSEEIAEKRADPGEDILSLLLSARDEEGQGLSDQGILDQLFTMVMAGHETTASSLAYALYFLHQHPEALARLREELEPLGRDLDPAAVVRLPYLEAVCQETLRLRPILPIVTRKLRRPLTLKGYELPEGIVVGAAVWLAHYREEVFPEPNAFKPERFLGKTYSPFEFVPFGGGARRCLGAAFAMYEMKIVLATLVARHRMKLEEPKPVVHELRAASFGPKGGVRMVLEERL